MKLTDISKKALVEALGKEAQSTGFLTEDLVHVAEAHHGEWSTPVTAQQLLEEMGSWPTK